MKTKAIMPKHNENKLSLIYDKRQKDFVVKYPKKCDGALALNHIVGDVLEFRLPLPESGFVCPLNYEKTNFVEELERRGYDLSTLKFSIELKSND